MKINCFYIGRYIANSAAFSLPEVVVGLGVVGVTVVALYGALTSGFGAVQMGRENQRATQILVEKIDTFRLYTWEQLNDPSFVPTNFVGYFDPETSSGLVYNGTVQIGPAPNDTSYSTNLKSLIIEVSWTSASRLPRNRQFTTFIAKDGLQSYIY